jgi:transcriptional regulator with GAF, ATPase, and Fis domain
LQGNAIVLLFGETGTGKEAIARLIYQRSPRAGGPFKTLNCGAIAPGLLMSELFGHCKGAFTDAKADRAGVFEAADGGTLFLDEIGELSAEAQAALLRVVEYGEIQRVGETDTRKVDVQLIAATNRDLVKMVRAGEFREDLFHRLYDAPILVPALRERLDDLPLLVWHFAIQATEEFRQELREIEPELLKRLTTQKTWNGNVRELRQYMRKLVRRNRTGVFSITDLPPLVFGSGYVRDAATGELKPYAAEKPAPAGPDQADLFVTGIVPWDELSRRYFTWVIQQNEGNKAAAARALHLKKTTFLKMLTRVGIQGD